MHLHMEAEIRNGILLVETVKLVLQHRSTVEWKQKSGAKHYTGEGYSGKSSRDVMDKDFGPGESGTDIRYENLRGENVNIGDDRKPRQLLEC